MIASARLSSLSIQVKHFPWLVIAPILLGAVFVIALLTWSFYHANQLQQRVDRLTGQQQELLYEQHLQALNQHKLQSEKSSAENRLQELQSDEHQARSKQVNDILSQFQAVKGLVDRNNERGLDSDSIVQQYQEWGVQLLSGELDQVASAMTAASEWLDQQYSQHLAQLAKQANNQPPAVSQQQNHAAGYSIQTVTTGAGSFNVHLIKLPLSQYNLKTLTANNQDCTNNCPTKPLAQYVTENNGYAGINGTYFCPPDYASCAGKTNSFDFAVYNSNLGKWINQPARFWDSTGMATFSGASAAFYRTSNQYPGGAISAGISNFPPLLVQNGQVATSPAQHTAHQQAKNTKGALGVDDSHYYLAVISSASLMDAAQVMVKLGAQQVLNLDGGGSAALYIGGGYKVGPGRSLPNAVVLTPK